MKAVNAATATKQTDNARRTPSGDSGITKTGEPNAIGVPVKNSIGIRARWEVASSKRFATVFILSR
ncbi:MAG: hypothetical protein ABSG33_07710 [Candidatus Bathyarchaeia archaeon]